MISAKSFLNKTETGNNVKNIKNKKKLHKKLHKWKLASVYTVRDKEWPTDLDDHVVTSARGVVKWSATLRVFVVYGVLGVGRQQFTEHELSGRPAVVTTRQVERSGFVLTRLSVQIYISQKQHMAGDAPKLCIGF